MKFYYGRDHMLINEVDVATIMNSYIRDSNGNPIIGETLVEGLVETIDLKIECDIVSVVIEEPGIYLIRYASYWCNEYEYSFEDFMALLRPMNNPKSANKV